MSYGQKDIGTRPTREQPSPRGPIERDRQPDEAIREPGRTPDAPEREPDAPRDPRTEPRTFSANAASMNTAQHDGVSSLGPNERDDDDGDR